MAAEVIDKATGTIAQVSTDTIDLESLSVVRIHANREDVEALYSTNDDLLIQMKDGKLVTIDNFYKVQPGGYNELVLQDDSGAQWLTRANGSLPRFSLLNDIDELLGAAGGAGGGGGEDRGLRGRGGA